jgi:hypothetical protein
MKKAADSGARVGLVETQQRLNLIRLSSNRWYFPFTKIPWVKEGYRKPFGCQEKPFGAFIFIRLSARH